ncbi:MAG: hypothetical protein J5856_02760 [Lachnospiraceae bacterium]|nr:hypothetical protein [Lachnospiraceae bacterium]
MNTFWGTVKSYLFGAVLLILGLGVFFYFSFAHGKVADSEEAVDITYGTGFDMDDLKPGMHIQVTVNNNAGYDHFFINKLGKQEAKKVYFSYDTPWATKDKDPLILTFMPSEYNYSDWDNLTASDKVKKGYNKTILFNGYAVKMTLEQFKDVRNVYVVSGVDDPEEMEKIIVPYYFVNSLEETKNDTKIGKFASLAAAALGLIMLVGSVIGTIINRY